MPLHLRAIPRDGGTLVGLGAALAGLSAFSGIDHLRLGAAGYPVWPVAALDAVIACSAGLVLVVGSRLFSGPDVAPAVDPEFVPVRRAVWEAVQAEVAAGRRARATIAATLPIPRPTVAAPADATLAPWDEGPPTPPPVAPTALTPLAASSAIPPSPEIPAKAPATPPVKSTTAAPIPPAPKLTREDVEEAEKLRRILGISAPAPPPSSAVPAAFSRPVGASGTSRGTATKRSADAASKPGDVPEIDELMAWLDQMDKEQSSRSLTSGRKPEAKPTDTTDENKT